MTVTKPEKWHINILVHTCRLLLCYVVCLSLNVQAWRHPLTVDTCHNSHPGKANVINRGLLTSHNAGRKHRHEGRSRKADRDRAGVSAFMILNVCLGRHLRHHQTARIT